MPELPDITVYIDALSERLTGSTLLAVKINSPFLLRTVEPPLVALEGQKVSTIKRIGKRIAIGLDNDHWLVLHLMIAGRLQWIDPDKKIPARRPLADFKFTTGTSLFTEAGTKRRAALHLFKTERDMNVVDRGGIEVMNTSLDVFSKRLTLRNHTLKRALTDQALFSGIGNAFSDEILHHAKLSPVALTQKLSDTQITDLFNSTRTVLKKWLKTLTDERGENFPTKVTAFRQGMTVHGKYKQPCPVCDTKIQRIRYANNETNYCPRCQTGGKLLADRSMSRLLKKDWPKTIEELEDSTTRVTNKER